MDLFVYIPEFQVQVCKKCQRAIHPKHLGEHLREQHGFVSNPELRAIAAALRQVPLHDPMVGPVPLPAPNTPQFHCLALHEGLRCPKCPTVVRSMNTFVTHQSKRHSAGLPRGRKPKTYQPPPPVAPIPVHCQRFFHAGPGSSFFQVTVTPSPLELAAQQRRQTIRAQLSRRNWIRFQVEEQLAAANDQTVALENEIRDDLPQTEASPWLDMTRWPRYLDGQDLLTVARLTWLPSPDSEPVLFLVTQSLERLVKEGHRSVCEDRINVFNQARINSFIRQRRAFDRPLMVKLQRSTWRTYVSVWKRLLCFAWRTSRLDSPASLGHQLTAVQLTSLDDLVSLAEELQLSMAEPAVGEDRLNQIHLAEKRERQASLEQKLDKVCLRTCIALLDHTLRGDIYESVVVGFLAAVGIDDKKKTLKEAYEYTSILSAFVKVAQMLVIQRSVSAAESGETEYPGDLLDEMRDRFLLYGTHSPFNWALKLRAYGKKIRNSTTSLGYIYWSEDSQTLFYKNLELPMDGLREFIRIQLDAAQQELHELSLIHPDENRDVVVPQFHLRHLKDNLAHGEKGWNFLRDERNRSSFNGGDRWLLDRVLSTDWLEDEFLAIDRDATVTWLSDRANAYLGKRNAFLLRLALLIQLTWGAPARVRELFSLLYSNSISGHRRSIGIEEGLVGTVTTYHKGYSVSGSTKIIHRYLPREVGELLIYYLWLVLPFCHHLQQLALKKSKYSSPFLWPPQDANWERKFGIFLQREAQSHLNTDLSVAVYRHAAIAVSKTHLKCGGFKKDYEVEEKPLNQQTAHTSWTAGTIYARGIEEAPGFVESRRSEFRQVSREWHEFLGFQKCFTRQRRPLEDIINDQAGVDRPRKIRKLG